MRHAIKTDAQVQKYVVAKLDWEASVKSPDIGVQVKKGIVTVVGHVGSYAEKKTAKVAAQRARGVQGMAIERDVKLGVAASAPTPISSNPPHLPSHLTLKETRDFML